MKEDDEEIVNSSNQTYGMMTQGNANKQKQQLGNFQLIWLDTSFNYLDVRLNAEIRCRSISPDLITFSDAEQCWEYILNTDIDYFFVIITDESFLASASALVQITFLYLLSPSPSSSIDNIKLRGIFENEKELLQKIADDVELCFQKSTKFSLFALEKSSEDISRESLRFIWYQHLVEILLAVPEPDVAKQEMIKFCRTCYSDDNLELAKISEFEHDYCSEKAIKWYTRDSFLYRLLNQVLRSQHIDQMYAFRFILSDLNTQLIELHANYLEKLVELDLVPYTLNVYRGQLMSIQELDRLKRNILGFMSMNTFLSTSCNRQVALIFSGLGGQRPQLESVLFEITIETSTCNSAFAEINTLGWMRTHEDEILITFGVIFQIQSVHEDENHVWVVRLALCNRDTKLIPRLQDLFPQWPTWNYPTNLVTLAWCLGEMGESKRAHEIYKRLMREPSTATFDCWNNLAVTSIEHQGVTNVDEILANYQEALNQVCEKNTDARVHILLNMTVCFLSQGHIDKARILLEESRLVLMDDNNISTEGINVTLLARYNMIVGNLHAQQEQYAEARNYFQDAYKIFSSRFSTENENCAHIETYIGEIEVMSGNYSQAILRYRNALLIYSNCYPSGHRRIASCHHYIGSAHFHAGQAIEAQQSLELALRLRLQCQSIHPEELAQSYYCLGQLFDRNENHQEALIYFRKTFDIYQSCLPENHAKYAHLFADLGLTYGKMADHKLGLEYLTRALQIECKRSTSSNLLGHIYLKMGVIHGKNGVFKEALDVLKKALAILEPNRPSSDEILASALNEIAYTYQQLGDHEMALNKYRVAHDIVRTQELTSIICGNIGAVLIDLEKYDEAIIYLKKELVLRREYLSNQSAALITCYINLGNAYCELKDYSSAFTYLAQALRNTPTGTPNDRTADIFTAIGGVYFNQETYEDALVSYQTALGISTNCLSANHLTLAGRLQNVANTYTCMNEPNKAAPLLERALNIYDLNLPPTHLYIVRCIDSIIYTYVKLENYDALEKNLTKRLAISEALNLELDSTLASVYEIFGFICNVQGRYLEALAHYDKIEAFRLMRHDSILLTFFLKKGAVYYNLVRYDMALEYYERALMLTHQEEGSIGKLIDRAHYAIDRIMDHLLSFSS